MKVLIIQTASLGDVILATAAANSIKDTFPNSKIHFVAKNNCSNVLENNNLIDRIFTWNKDKNKYWNLIKVIRKIRQRKYDVVINFHRFSASGAITLFAKSKIKAGYKNNPLSIFFNRKIVYLNNNIHEITRNFMLTSKCFENIQEKKPFIYSIYPKNSRIQSVIKNPYITIFSGSLWATKQYHIDGWIDFIENIDLNLNVIFMGVKADKAIVDNIICKRPKNSHDFCGKTSIHETAWIMKNAIMNFTNDSAPTHIASAVNAHVTTIFCSTIPKFGFTPLSEKSFIVEADVDCRPCGIHGHKSCPKKHFRCAKEIKSSQLLNSLKNG